MSSDQKSQNEGRLAARLRNVDPYEFEELVAELWELNGWDATVSSGSNDRGVDITAEKDEGLTTTTQAIQVKRYSADNRITRDKVQQYHAMQVQDAKVDQAVVVTTSDFSRGAEEWAAEHGMQLIDIDDLLELVDTDAGRNILSDYAPAMSEAESLDPADTERAVEQTDAQTATDTDLNRELPGELGDPETQRKVGLGIAGIGLIIATPFVLPGGIGGVIGAGLMIGGLALGFAGNQLYDTFTDDITVYREFDDGGMVIQLNEEVRYRFGDDREDTTFDDFVEPAARRRQANLYGVLVTKRGGSIDEIENAVPTDVVSEGDAAVAAYRYAIHGDQPERIAAEMNMTQQEVVSLLETYSESV